MEEIPLATMKEPSDVNGGSGKGKKKKKRQETAETAMSAAESDVMGMLPSMNSREPTQDVTLNMEGSPVPNGVRDENGDVASIGDELANGEKETLGLIEEEDVCHESFTFRSLLTLYYSLKNILKFKY